MNKIPEHIVIEVLDEQCLNDFCVYKIWFGSHFYIGSTVDVLKRIECHYKFINSTIENGHKYGENSTTRIANHILRNIGIKTAYFEVLEVCVSEVELVEVEYFHLQKHYGDKFCLNVGKHTSRRIGNEIYHPSKMNERPIVSNNPFLPISRDLVFLKMLQKSLKNIGLIA